MLAMGRRTSLGCLHAFHEDGMAGYKIRHNMMMRGLPRQDHRDHEGEKVMKKWGRGEGAKHAESVQWQQYPNGVFNLFGLFNIFPTHLPAYYKARLWIN